MNIGATVKRVPKWAIFASGGVVLGAGAIRLVKNRTTAEDDSTELAPADGAYQLGAGGVQGVIVPPIVMPPESNDDGGAVIGLLTDAFSGIVGAYDTLYGQVWGPVQGQNQQILDALLGGVMNGGTAPQPYTDNPAPIGSPTPIPDPAVPPVIPVPTGGEAQPTTGAKCADSYPNYPKHNPKNGPVSKKSCYRTVCRNKKRTNEYRDGHYVVLGDKC